MTRSLWRARLEDTIIGARIVAVEAYDEPLVKLIFEHRGTDDGSGYLIVGPSTVRFDEDESPDEAAIQAFNEEMEKTPRRHGPEGFVW